jgi:hypothetical protein
MPGEPKYEPSIWKLATTVYAPIKSSIAPTLVTHTTAFTPGFGATLVLCPAHDGGGGGGGGGLTSDGGVVASGTPDPASGIPLPSPMMTSP